jgi:hypothetical protein
LACWKRKWTWCHRIHIKSSFVSILWNSISYENCSANSFCSNFVQFSIHKTTGLPTFIWVDTNLSSVKSHKMSET